MTGWFSPLVMNKVLTFFDRVLPTNSGLAANNYIYTVWNIFKAVALLSLVALTVEIIVLLVKKTGAFSAADLGTPELRSVGDGKAKLVFWCLQLISTVGCILIIAFLNSKGLASYRNAIFRSANPTYHGLIALLCGMLIVILFTVWYFAFGKKSGFDFKETGIEVNCKLIVKTVLVSLLGIAIMLGIVFVVDYFFDVNFLFVYWGFMKFLPNRIPGMILVCPAYIAFYVALSVSVNGFNFHNGIGKNRVVSDVVTALIAAIPTLFILAYVYLIFMATGNNPMFGGLASAATAVFAFPGFVFIATLVCRALYRSTGNMYLGGVFSGLCAAIAEWNVCEIRVHTAGATYASTGLFYALIVIGFGVIIGCALALKKNAAK